MVTPTENLLDLLSVEEEEGQHKTEALVPPPTVEATATSTVKAQLPSFYKGDPEFFFLQAETVFELYNVRDSVKKFRFVVAQLDRDAGREVIDLIRTPPEHQPYETLRARLMATYGESDNLRIRRLLEDQRLGDRKPSQFLRELRSLGGSAVSDDLLRSIWLRALPDRFQAALAATDQGDLTILSTVADRIAEIYEPRINEVSAVAPARNQGYESRLLTAIEQLTSRVAALETGRTSAGHSRAGPRPPTPRSRSKSRDRSLCYYHNRFGARATKCRPPCEWKKRSGN